MGEVLGEACAKSPSGRHEFTKFGICSWCGKASSYKVALERAQKFCVGIISDAAREDCIEREMKKLGWTRSLKREIIEEVPTTEPLFRKSEREFLSEHPTMDAVWKTLDLDRTLIPSGKNALWQDFVAAWNRRGILTNEEAEMLLQLRFKA